VDAEADGAVTPLCNMHTALQTYANLKMFNSTKAELQYGQSLMANRHYQHVAVL